jgi:hypothetical protein
VKLVPDADITIELLENHWVSIRCGPSNTSMFGMRQFGGKHHTTVGALSPRAWQHADLVSQSQILQVEGCVNGRPNADWQSEQEK